MAAEANQQPTHPQERPLSPEPHYDPQPAGQSPAANGDTTMAQIAHLGTLVSFVGIPGIIAPLIVYLTRRDDPLAAPHAREAMNFQITWMLVGLISVVVVVVTLGIGALLVFPVAIAGLVAWIMGLVRGMKAISAGQATVHYPLTIRMLK